MAEDKELENLADRVRQFCESHELYEVVKGKADLTSEQLELVRDFHAAIHARWMKRNTQNGPVNG